MNGSRRAPMSSPTRYRKRRSTLNAPGGRMPEQRYPRAYIQAAATTPSGPHEGQSALDLMAQAANAALAQSGLQRGDIDGVLCGYATTFPHLMLADLLSEKLGLQPHYAH